MILVPGTPQDKKRELMIGSIMTGASSLAVMDDSSTSTVLRAIAHMLDQQVQREFKLCTHGCDISPSCKHRTKNSCGLKTTECEDAPPTRNPCCDDPVLCEGDPDEGCENCGKTYNKGEGE